MDESRHSSASGPLHVHCGLRYFRQRHTRNMAQALHVMSCFGQSTDLTQYLRRCEVRFCDK